MIVKTCTTLGAVRESAVKFNCKAGNKDMLTSRSSMMNSISSEIASVAHNCIRIEQIQTGYVVDLVLHAVCGKTRREGVIVETTVNLDNGLLSKVLITNILVEGVNEL